MPVATVSFQYMPVITINDALMASLTDEQREEWVASTPGNNEVFRLNKATQQVARCNVWCCILLLAASEPCCAGRQGETQAGQQA